MSRKWNSVLDAVGNLNLPKKSGLYIVYIQEPLSFRTDGINSSYADAGWYDKDTGLWKIADDGYYCANLNCINTENTYFISHWMSMPNPPKKEKTE